MLNVSPVQRGLAGGVVVACLSVVSHFAYLKVAFASWLVAVKRVEQRLAALLFHQ